jgi:hypothetical protein
MRKNYFLGLLFGGIFCVFLMVLTLSSRDRLGIVSGSLRGNLGVMSYPTNPYNILYIYYPVILIFRHGHTTSKIVQIYNIFFIHASAREVFLRKSAFLS